MKACHDGCNENVNLIAIRLSAIVQGQQAQTHREP